LGLVIINTGSWFYNQHRKKVCVETSSLKTQGFVISSQGVNPKWQIQNLKLLDGNNTDNAMSVSCASSLFMM
jgi:hypothetical protein